MTTVTKPSLRYQRVSDENEAKRLAQSWAILDMRPYSVVDTGPEGELHGGQYVVAWGAPSEFPKVDADRIIFTTP